MSLISINIAGHSEHTPMNEIHHGTIIETWLHGKISTAELQQTEVWNVTSGSTVEYMEY